MWKRLRASLYYRSDKKRGRRAARRAATKRAAFHAFGCEQLERRELLTAAATITWTGGSASSANWSDPANWNLGRAPVNGDNLVFPASANQLANNDDVAGLNVNSIAFEGMFDASGGYTLSGDDLTLGAGGITDNGAAYKSVTTTIANQIDLNVALAAAQKWSIEDIYRNDHLVVSGNVANNGFTLSLGGTGAIDMAGEISGGGGLSVIGDPVPLAVVLDESETTDSQAISGAGLLTLDLDHANSFTGATYVNSATVVIAADGALGPGGASDAGTTVDSIGEILFNNVAYGTPEAINLNDGILAAAGSSSFSGPITISGTSASPGFVGSGDAEIVLTEPSATFTLNGPTLTNNGDANLFVRGDEVTPQVSSDADVVINNVISGAGGLTLKYGTLALGAANTYQGSTDLIGPATLLVNANDAIPDTSTVVVQSSGLLGLSSIELNGHSDTIGSLAGTQAFGTGNTIDLGTGGSLTTGGDNSSTTFAGDITGAGSLIKVGGVTFDLTAKIDFTGTTEVSAGTLLVDGSTATGNAVTVQPGATLGGTGTVGGTIALVPSVDQLAIIPAPGGILDPGAGPDPSKHAGTLSNGGGVILGAAARPPSSPVVGFGRSGPAVFAVQLGGTAANLTNDQLDSTGTITLEFAALDLTALPGAGLFKAGQQFVIVQAGAPIEGTFSDLPEGSTVSDGEQNFTISYANDRVTLTAQPLSPTAVYLNAQSGDGTAATFVHNLYRELLGREPAAAGQAFWVNVFAQLSAQHGAAAAQRAIVADFLGSAEYRTHLVEGLYESFLHRQADALGLAFWTSELAAGVDEKRVLAAILGSNEYARNSLGPGAHPDNTFADAQSWVTALYQDVLGRAADPGGLAYWTQRTMQSGRTVTAFEFLGSPETEHKLLNADYPSAAGPVVAPGSPAAGDYALAEITGNGWDHLYFHGGLSGDEVDALFAQLQSGEFYGEAIADMLETPRYFG